MGWGGVAYLYLNIMNIGGRPDVVLLNEMSSTTDNYFSHQSFSFLKLKEKRKGINRLIGFKSAERSKYFIVLIIKKSHLTFIPNRTLKQNYPL